MVFVPEASASNCPPALSGARPAASAPAFSEPAGMLVSLLGGQNFNKAAGKMIEVICA